MRFFPAPTVARALSLFLLLMAGLAPAASPAPAAAPPEEPHGWAAMRSLERLPYLKLGVRGGQASSYDRNALNNDGFDATGFLYTDAQGEKVMLDLNGPGEVHRMWFAGFNFQTAWVKIYLDGEATPRLHALVRELTSGGVAGFPAPLVGNDFASSAGFYSYVPIAFARSIRITTNAAPAPGFFYQIGYHLYEPTAQVTSWTAAQSDPAVRELWNRAGETPARGEGMQETSGTLTLPAGASRTLLTLDGPRWLHALRLRLPGVAQLGQRPPRLSDDGRAHKGYSQFRMAVDPANQGVILVRRLDFGIGDQKAQVYVDGALVGEWFNRSGDGGYRWRDRRFNIPASFTAGKSALTIKVQFVSSSIDWNELYYWAYSVVDGEERLSDSLDVGKAAAESAHQYTINTQMWAGTVTFTYPPWRELEDDGRVHAGVSRFKLKIDPQHEAVRLTRRADAALAGQQAEVLVDGTPAGTWSGPERDTLYRWRDVSLDLPTTLTAGKSELSIEVRHTGGAGGLSEYAYWSASRRGGAWRASDWLNVGEAGAEAAHAYSVTSPLRSGSELFHYPPQSQPLSDGGRAHQGFSQFRLALRPDNRGAILRRRLDLATADQQATVYVDGQAAGLWRNGGQDGARRWRESSFYLPEALTAGKSAVTIKLQNATAGGGAWNEFYYWLYSVTGDGQQLSDELDVGTAASESAHAYQINQPSWGGSLTATHPSTGAGDDEILNNTWLRVYYDDETAPSINAPLGDFFALGGFGPYGTRSLALGLDEEDTLYCYLPMPFKRRARLELASQRASETPGIAWSVRHKPYSGEFDRLGYLKTQFGEVQHTAGDRTDIKVVETSGAGHFIGVVHSMRGPTTRGYLEGDERVYLDDSLTPAYHGTGTEDLYNAAWYFAGGLFTLPTHGCTAHLATSQDDVTAAYRFYLHDAIPFRRHLRYGIEHGGNNDVNELARTLGFYYHQSRPLSELSDTLDVGDTASEAAHDYQITQPTVSGSRSLQYEGENYRQRVTDTLRAHKGTSEFNLRLHPANRGALLRRRLDQSVGSQKANVYVDGQPAGVWYTAGSNTKRPLRDAEFLLPAALTQGKVRVRVRLEFVSSVSATGEGWNEFRYWAYSLLEPELARAAAQGKRYNEK